LYLGECYLQNKGIANSKQASTMTA